MRKLRLSILFKHTQIARRALRRRIEALSMAELEIVDAAVKALSQ